MAAVAAVCGVRVSAVVWSGRACVCVCVGRVARGECVCVVSIIKKLSAPWGAKSVRGDVAAECWTFTLSARARPQHYRRRPRR